MHLGRHQSITKSDHEVMQNERELQLPWARNRLEEEASESRLSGRAWYYITRAKNV
jgi:hypothetical protein